MVAVKRNPIAIFSLRENIECRTLDFIPTEQEASWTNPHEGADASGSALVTSNVAGDGGTAEGANGAGGGAGAAMSQREDSRTQWTECMDEASGKPYYYNAVTVRSK